jgi:glycosyltransferase involved in cell wall biosynthesis
VSLNQKALLPDGKSLAASVSALTRFCREIRAFQIPTDSSKVKWLLLLFFNLFSKAPYSVWRFSSKEMSHEIRRMLQSNRFDLVYFDTIDLMQYADLAPGVSKALNHHNSESMLLFRRSANHKNPLAKFYLRLQGMKLRKYETVMMGTVAVNLVCSESDKSELMRLVPAARFEIIPNGTDTEYFQPTECNEHSYELVFAGGMNWYPNKDAMLFFCREILPIIRKEYPDVSINIIGQQPPWELRSAARKDQSMKIHGHVKDIRDYLARSAVYVVPIRVGGGTRLKILDAFSCGKAVVSTSIGCEGIEVSPGEDILIGDSPREFAQQVIRLLGDVALRAKLESNARKLVEEKYSWSIIGRNLDRILEGLK